MNERELITARQPAPTFNETVRPRTADDLTPAELAAATIDMGRVLEGEPQLGDFGFGVWAGGKDSRLACGSPTSTRPASSGSSETIADAGTLENLQCSHMTGIVRIHASQQPNALPKLIVRSELGH